MVCLNTQHHFQTKEKKKSTFTKQNEFQGMHMSENKKEYFKSIIFHAIN